jgi:hypothetical protein
LHSKAKTRILTLAIATASSSSAIMVVHLIVRKDDGRVRFLAGKAGNIFEAAKIAAFSVVDIKGQK